MQKIVGSPAQLHEWSQMDRDTVNSVVASNFQRSYKARAKNERDFLSLPSMVKNFVASIADRMAMPRIEGGEMILMENNLIIAIDPGCTESGFVVVRHDGTEIVEVVEKGKVENQIMYQVMSKYERYSLAIEMVASYGMPVGAEVFETCIWIGRFWEYAVGKGHIENAELIYRSEEKMLLCGQMRARDANVRQAIVDRYAKGQPNKGKGTMKNPGFFYGFSKDIWQAMAVAVTYFDKYVRGIKI